MLLHKVFAESLLGDLVTDISLYSPGHALPNTKHDKRNCTNCNSPSRRAVETNKTDVVAAVPSLTDLLEEVSLTFMSVVSIM